MEEPETIAALLAGLMADRGLSARGLSLKAGLKATAVRDILNGRSKHPRPETIAKLAAALDLTMGDLIPEKQKEILLRAYANDHQTINREGAARHLFGTEAVVAGHVVFGDLKAADFSGANLAGASFIGARLTGANFSRANLSITNFTGCDLRGANFQDAVFDLTVFVQADLRGANLAGVDLSKAIFVASGPDSRGHPPDET